MNQKLEKSVIILFGMSLVLNYVSKTFFYIDSVLIFLLTLFLVNDQNTSYKKLFEYKLPLILILSYTVLLVINFVNVTDNYSKNIGLIFHFLILYCLYYYLVISTNKNKNLNLILKTFFISISFLSILLIISFLSSIDIIYTIKNLKLITYNPSAYHSSQTFLTIGIGLLLYYLRKNLTSINIVLFIFVLFATFVVEGKTALITLFVGLFIYFISYMLLSKKLSLINFLGSIAIVCFSIYLMLYIRNDSISDFNINDFTSGRFNGWELYIDLISKKNTLFGFGIFGGKVLSEQGLLGFSHPHNIFIETLFTTGVIGLIVLIVLFILYIKKIYFIITSPEKKAIIITTFFTVFISSQGFWSIWSKNHVIPIMIIIAISLLLIEETEEI